MAHRDTILAYLHQAGLSTPRANANIDKLLQEHAPLIAPAQWSTIRELVAWLDGQNGRTDQEVTHRILKLAEEVGEVAQARIGMIGQNPRKGVSHTREDVADELCDVVVTALVALTSLVDDPAGHLDTKLARIAGRPRTP